MRVKGKGLGVLGAMLVSVAMASAHSETNKTYETRVIKKTIPHSVSYELSRTLSSGRTLAKKKGKDGSLITTYKITFVNGKPVSKVAMSQKRVEPVNEVVVMGKPTFNVSRSSFNRKKTISMSATGYDVSPQTLPGSSGRTATGMPARFGVVAVDPRIIPLGTYVYVDGYGFAIAADTGGAIKGNKIDLCFDSRRESMAWGRRTVKVHVLGK